MSFALVVCQALMVLGGMRVAPPSMHTVIDSTVPDSITAILRTRLAAALDTIAHDPNNDQALYTIVTIAHTLGDTLHEFRALGVIDAKTYNAWRRFGDVVGPEHALYYMETRKVLDRKHRGDFAKLYDAEDLWYAIALSANAHAWTKVLAYHKEFAKLDHNTPDLGLLASLLSAAYALHDSARVRTLGDLAAEMYHSGLERDWYVERLVATGEPPESLLRMVQGFLQSYPHDVYLLCARYSLAVQLNDWSTVAEAGPALVEKAPRAADMIYFATMYRAYTLLKRPHDTEALTAQVSKAYRSERLRTRWAEYVTEAQSGDPDAALGKIRAEFTLPSEPGAGR